MVYLFFALFLTYFQSKTIQIDFQLKYHTKTSSLTNDKNKMCKYHQTTRKLSHFTLSPFWLIESTMHDHRTQCVRVRLCANFCFFWTKHAILAACEPLVLVIDVYTRCCAPRREIEPSAPLTSLAPHCHTVTGVQREIACSGRV